MLGVEKYDFLIRNCAEETLQKNFRGNLCGGNKTSEPIWMTEGLRREIKIRKNMNKRQRNCKIEDREKNLRLYIQQKGLVKQMIRDELAKHEKMITREIREAKDSGIKMWNMINKLRGIEKTEKEIPLIVKMVNA